MLTRLVRPGLIKFVKEGESATSNPGLVQLRGFTYSALGQLALRAQHLFLVDVSIAELLFESLASEPPEVKVSVQEALSMSCTAYRGVCGGRLSSPPTARFWVVRSYQMRSRSAYAAAFPFEHEDAGPALTPSAHTQPAAPCALSPMPYTRR